MDFPIKNGGSFHSYVKLPEGNINQQPVGLQLLPKEQKKERPATLWAWHRTEVEDVSRENRGTTYLYNWTKLEHMIYTFFFPSWVLFDGDIIYEPDQRVQLSIARVAEVESHDTY